MMKTFSSPAEIRVGVIGYGGTFNMGREHLERARAAGMTPVAVADRDPARLEAARADFPGIACYRSAGRMLRDGDVNLAVIVTPHNTHARLALRCLRAGRHVVCEKPMGLTTAEADAMIRAAREAGVMLSACHNRHWDPHMLMALELARRRRAVGRVFRIQCRKSDYARPGDWWRSSRRISGGALFDWGVHLLEYALQLVDSPLTEVSGFAQRGFWGPRTRWGEEAIEDDGFVLARFAGGEHVTLSVSSVESNPKAGWVEVTGPEGTLVFGGTRTALIQNRDGVETTTRLADPPGEHWRYYQNIADYLTGKAELIITPEWARRPVHILDLAMRSAAAGRALRARYG